MIAQEVCHIVPTLKLSDLIGEVDPSHLAYHLYIALEVKKMKSMEFLSASEITANKKKAKEKNFTLNLIYLYMYTKTLVKLYSTYSYQ